MRCWQPIAACGSGGPAVSRLTRLSLIVAIGLAGGVPAFGGQDQDRPAAQAGEPRTTAGFDVGAADRREAGGRAPAARRRRPR